MHLKPVPGCRFLSGYGFVKYKKQRMPVFCRFGTYLKYYYEIFINRYFKARHAQSPGREGGMFLRTFAGVLSFLLCRIFTLKNLCHLSERSEL